MIDKPKLIPTTSYQCDKGLTWELKVCKYPITCDVCGEKILKGMPILWSTRHNYVHRDCAEVQT